MSLTYLAGYDGSAAARAAVKFTRRLARVTGARTVAAHIYPAVAPVAQPIGPTVMPGYYGGDLQAHAARSAELLLEGLGDGVVRRAVADRSVPAGLNAVAAAEQAALLAIGATHRGRFGRIVPGSVGERAVHGSRCPVLVVPSREAQGRIRRVLVPYDGRAEAVRALETAAGLAEVLKARLLLVGVIETAEFYDRPGNDAARLDDVLELHLGEALEQGALKVADRVGVQTQLVIGDTAHALADVAAASADLVVSGSRGYGPVRSVLLGGVARHLVDHAPCPVMIVPRGVTVSVVEDSAAGSELIAGA